MLFITEHFQKYIVNVSEIDMHQSAYNTRVFHSRENKVKLRALLI